MPRASPRIVHLLLTAIDVAPLSTGFLLLVGAIGVGIAIDRAIVVARSRLSGHGRPFIERIVAMIQAGQIDEALAACAGTRAILPDIGLIVLRTRLREERDLEAVVEAAIRSTTPRLSRRLRLMPASSLAVVLAGAGGSAGAAVGLPTGQPAGWEVLAPLALGLLVAAPMVLVHALLANQIDAITAQVGEFSRRLANALLDRPDVRLGHR